MNEKLIIRIESVDERDEYNSVIFLTADNNLVNKVRSVVNSIISLEQPASGIAPVRIDFSVDTLVFEGDYANNELLVDLWDLFGDVVVDKFPELNGEPITARITLSIEKPTESNRKFPQFCTVWLSYRSDNGTYQAPIRFLGDLVERLFADGLVVAQ